MHLIDSHNTVAECDTTVTDIPRQHFRFHSDCDLFAAYYHPPFLRRSTRRLTTHLRRYPNYSLHSALYEGGCLDCGTILLGSGVAPESSSAAKCRGRLFDAGRYGPSRSLCGDGGVTTPVPDEAACIAARGTAAFGTTGTTPSCNGCTQTPQHAVRNSQLCLAVLTRDRQRHQHTLGGQYTCTHRCPELRLRD